MPPDFALVLGGTTVFNPVCGRPARWRTRSSSRRTSPHGTALHARPRTNDHLSQHSSRSDEFDTRNFSSLGSPGERRWAANLRSDPVVPPVSGGTTEPTTVQRGQVSSGTGWQSRLDVKRNDITECDNKPKAYRIIVTMNQKRETDTLCLCRVIGCICPLLPPPPPDGTTPNRSRQCKSARTCTID